MDDGAERTSNPEWRATLMGEGSELARVRRIMRHLPSDPRCKMCLSPQGGIGGPIMELLGYGRYPPNPQLCNSCFRQSEKHPGGAEIEITALFADVRGSTGLAETMSPAEYSAAVNDYVRAATRAIREPNGLVDKLLGDGIMALFIPGFVGGDHAAAGVEAARTILRAVALPVGIGLHSGEAWVGFVGGVDQVRDFTALGDAVNVTARLASVAPAGEVLISESSYAAARDELGELEVRQLDVKGRDAPVDVRVLHVSPARQPATV
jgi:adenylate cyclase